MRRWQLAGFVLTCIAVGVATTVLRAPRTSPQTVRSAIELPRETPLDPEGGLALSPDGRWLLFGLRSPGGVRTLWLRSLESGELQPVTGSEGGFEPFWAPDSERFGFFARRQLLVGSTRLDPPVVIANAPDGRGGAWSTGEVILFSPEPGSGLMRTGANGGRAERVTHLNPERGEWSHRFPCFLPDGRHYLFTIASSIAAHAGVYLGRLDEPRTVRVAQSLSRALFVPPGYLAYAQDGSALVQPFNLRSPARLTAPHRLGVTLATGLGAGSYLLAGSATAVAWVSADATEQSRLIWYDRSGRRLGGLGRPADEDPVISSDARQVAVIRIGERDERTVQIIDLATSTTTRLAERADASPVWSPAGNAIVYGADHPNAGRNGLHVRSLATGEEQILPVAGREIRPRAWAADGGSVVFDAVEMADFRDIWRIPLAGAQQRMPLVRTPLDDAFGMPSPDGRWIAFAANDYGRPHVFVQPMEGGTRVQFPSSAGTEPKWRHDGRELFYLTPEGEVTAVPILAGARLAAGAPATLFEVTPATTRRGARTYDVTADGQRFIINTAERQGAGAPITVTRNWSADLRR